MKKYYIILAVISTILLLSYISLDALARKDWIGDSPLQVIQRLKLSGMKNKKQCLSYYMDTYKECNDGFCLEKSKAYAAICLRGPKGDKNKFCSSNSNFNQEYIDVHKKVGFCKILGIDIQKCEPMYTPLQSYCESEA